ncbi:MAG: hypothetical protein QXI64_09815 [Sulfolobales archaeon]
MDRERTLLLAVFIVSSLCGGILNTYVASQRYSVMYMWGDWAYIPDGVYLVRIYNGSLMLERMPDPVFIFGTPFIGSRPLGDRSVLFFYSKQCGATNAFKDVLENVLSRYQGIEIYVTACTDLSDPARGCMDRGARGLVMAMGVNGSFPFTPDMVVVRGGEKLYLHDFAARYASSNTTIVELVMRFIEEATR